MPQTDEAYKVAEKLKKGGMIMAQKKYGAYPKRVKPVTRTPGWILRIKGRRDSRKGKGVCDEYIRRQRRRLGVAESREVIHAENRLFSSRKEAAVLLARLSELTKTQAEIISYNGDSRAETIRANRRNAQRRAEASEEIREIIKKLTMINEMLINTDLVLDEKINKLRSGLEEKFHAYAAGVRAGKLQEYEYEKDDGDDSAREIYRNRHNGLDGKIREIVHLYREEEAA